MLSLVPLESTEGAHGIGLIKFENEHNRWELVAIFDNVEHATIYAEKEFGPLGEV